MEIEVTGGAEPERPGVPTGTEREGAPRRDRRTPRNGGDRLIRAGALAGAAAALGMGVAAAARGGRSAAAWSGAAAVALPLAARGVTGEWPTPRTVRRGTPLEVNESLAVERSPEEVYDAWRNLEELPSILRHLEKVEVLGDGRSRWVARTPTGRRVEWRAEVLEDRRGDVLRWRSLPGSDVGQEGELVFRPWRPDGGTLITVRIRFSPAEGGLTGAAAGLLKPAVALGVREDLRRFKNRMEAGEVPTTAGQPSGARSPYAAGSPF